METKPDSRVFHLVILARSVISVLMWLLLKRREKSVLKDFTARKKGSSIQFLVRMGRLFVVLQVFQVYNLVPTGHIATQPRMTALHLVIRASPDLNAIAPQILLKYAHHRSTAKMVRLEHALQRNMALVQ